MTDPSYRPTDPQQRVDGTAAYPASTAAGAARPAQPDDARDTVAYDSRPDTLGDGRHVDGTATDDATREDARAARHDVLQREKEEFGGFKFGSAFFGWLTATGTALLLTALVAGTGTALGLATETTTGDATDAAAQNAQTVGIIGSVLLAVVLLVSYYCGGYVAGRMARFSGIKQGFAVWLWAIVIAIVVAIIGVIGGANFNVLANLNGFPRIPVNEGDLTTAGLITALAVAATSLVGALLGGMAGMRYHRRVDRVGLGG